MRWRLALLLMSGCALRPASTPPAPPPPAVTPQTEAASSVSDAPLETPAAVESPAAGEPHHDDHDDEVELDPATTPPDGVGDVASSGATRPPAMRYAALDKRSCEAELERRKIPFRRVDSARGVLAPVRLEGPLSGVTFRSNLRPAQRKTAAIEIYDCRLVLALD